MSAPIRFLIVDDEPLAIERLQLLLARMDGVARTTETVTLTIAAAEVDGRLRITIENDRGPDPKAGADHGTGLGLANVCARLAASFGDEAECDHQALPRGGYRVTIIMPLNDHV